MQSSGDIDIYNIIHACRPECGLSYTVRVTNCKSTDLSYYDKYQVFWIHSKIFPFKLTKNSFSMPNSYKALHALMRTGNITIRSNCKSVVAMIVT